MDPNTNRPNEDQEIKPDYDFIREVNEAIEHHDTDKDKRKRILIASAGGVGLIIVIVMLASLIFSGGPDITQRLVSIAQRQQEITRISEIGIDNARDSDVRQFATTTRSAMRSSQNDIVDLIEARAGRRVSQSQLRATESAQITQDLETARQANRFDIAFAETILSELTDYQTLLGIVARETSSANERGVLQALDREVTVLINQLAGPDNVDPDEENSEQAEAENTD